MLLPSPHPIPTGIVFYDDMSLDKFLTSDCRNTAKKQYREYSPH
jgi:hypothetical protein